MSHRRITLKADYPVEAGTYVQRTPPPRQDRRTPAWVLQEEGARFLEMIRLAEIPVWEQYRQQVQSESLRARKEYYGEAYGTMVVPEFEAHVKGWEQQQYRSLSSRLGKWRIEQITGYVEAQQAIPIIERAIIPAAPKGVVGGFTVDRDPLAISKGFYTDIGFPQYAGKYDPFLTPEGYKVKEITETDKGLQVSFMELPSDYSIPRFLPGIGIIQRKSKPSTEPLLLGLIPSPTKWQYIPGAGAIGISTSPYTIPGRTILASTVLEDWAVESEKLKLPGLPSPSGGLSFLAGATSTIDALLYPSEVTNIWQLPEKKPSYIAGRVAGEVVAGYMAGLALQQFVITPAKHTLPKIGAIAKTFGVKVGTGTYKHIVEPSLKYGLGVERFSYLKSVSLPTFKHVTFPHYIETMKYAASQGIKQPFMVIGKTVLPEQLYSFGKTVLLPNIAHSTKLLKPTLSYWTGYLPSLSLPAVHKPLVLSMAKSVYLPNIMHPTRIFAPTLSLWKQAYLPHIGLEPFKTSITALPKSILGTEAYSLIHGVYLPNLGQPLKVWAPTAKLLYAQNIALYPHLPSLTKPAWVLEAKAFSKVAIGKTRFELGMLHAPSFGLGDYIPMAEKAYGKTVMGRIRFELGIQAPKASMKPLWTPWEPITFKPRPITIFRTGKKSSLTLFKQAAKTTPKLAIPFIPVPPLTQIVKTKKKKKLKKKDTTVLVEWTGETFPSLFAMDEWGKPEVSQYPMLKQFQIPGTDKFKKDLAKITGSQQQLVRTPLKQKKREKQRIMPKIPRLHEGKMEDIPMQIWKGKSKFTSIQLGAQMQMQELKQIQIQKQLQLQLPSIPSLPSMPSFMFEYPQRKRKKLPSRKKGKTGRYKRQYPLMTPKEMLAKMVG